MAFSSLLNYPFHEQLREHLPIIPADRPLDQQHTRLAYFCAADAILLYMFSAIGSGLTVSFTLSLFAVVIKSRNPKLHSSPRTWRSFRWLWDPSTTALCVGPFIWALPVVCAAVEALTFCNIDDYRYQLVASIIAGFPLILSVGLSVATSVIIIQMYIRDRATTAQSINIPLALRFAAIVLQIFVITIVLLCEITLTDAQLKVMFRFHLYWAALGPLILFIIFGTQRDLIRIWRYWIYCLIGKEPTFTPRSSNEAAMLSNSSGPGTVGNGRYIVHA
ncbi:hypothetical protein FRC12_020671, partial [Ceratobasidium sp. 428]